MSHIELMIYVAYEFLRKYRQNQSFARGIIFQIKKLKTLIKKIHISNLKIVEIIDMPVVN